MLHAHHTALTQNTWGSPVSLSHPSEISGTPCAAVKQMGQRHTPCALPHSPELAAGPVCISSLLAAGRPKLWVGRG